MSFVSDHNAPLSAWLLSGCGYRLSEGMVKMALYILAKAPCTSALPEINMMTLDSRRIETFCMLTSYIIPVNSA